MFIKSYVNIKNDETVPKVSMGNSSQPQGIKLNGMSLEIEKNFTLAGGLKSGTGTLSRVLCQSVFFLPKLEVKHAGRKLTGARGTASQPDNMLLMRGSNPSGDRAGNCYLIGDWAFRSQPMLALLVEPDVFPIKYGCIPPLQSF